MLVAFDACRQVAFLYSLACERKDYSAERLGLCNQQDTVSKLAKLILKACGWSTIIPEETPSHCVICVAPHTSNWDFVLGKLYYSAVGRKGHFLMKREWFVFPIGLIMRGLGGIPVDRRQKGDLVQQVAKEFARHERFAIGITPEGTRRAVSQWKSGFYRIAMAAKVPILLAVIDYAQKQVGIFETFMPTGNVEEDIAYIRSRYSPAQARFPSKFI